MENFSEKVRHLLLRDDAKVLFIIILCFGLAITLGLTVRMLRRVKPMPKNQVMQHQINKAASEITPVPSRNRGCGYWIMFLIVLGLILFAAFMAYKGNIFLHPGR